jgi:hypothetical protein
MMCIRKEIDTDIERRRPRLNLFCEAKEYGPWVPWGLK